MLEKVTETNGLIGIALKLAVLIGFSVFFVFSRYNRVKRKGAVGERRVAHILNRLPKTEYKVLHDVMLSVPNDCTTQIDHVIISMYGIFVIETKNYSGWIFGHEHSEYWLQVIYRSKSRFRNPIKQNWSHIYALKSILKSFSNIRYFPIVVFCGDARFKGVQSNIPVVYDSRLLDEIRKHSVVKNLSGEDIVKIASLIRDTQCSNRKNTKKHIANIQKNVRERHRREKNMICPKCGAELKQRDGVYGKFYGCSNYPRCKFTMKY